MDQSWGHAGGQKGPNWAKNRGKPSFFACLGQLLLDNHGLMVINDYWYDVKSFGDNQKEKWYQMDQSWVHTGGKKGPSWAKNRGKSSFFACFG